MSDYEIFHEGSEIRVEIFFCLSGRTIQERKFRGWLKEWRAKRWARAKCRLLDIHAY